MIRDFPKKLAHANPKKSGSQTTYKVRVGGTTLPYLLSWREQSASPAYTTSPG